MNFVLVPWSMKDYWVDVVLVFCKSPFKFESYACYMDHFMLVVTDQSYDPLQASVFRPVI